MKKYSVLHFPSYLGSPVETNYYIIALAIGMCKWAENGGLCEIRITNNKTKEDKVYWI